MDRRQTEGWTDLSLHEPSSNHQVSKIQVNNSNLFLYTSFCLALIKYETREGT